MARFRGLHVSPYSGWPRRRWCHAFSTNGTEIDAAARSARRVTEAISSALVAIEPPLQAPRSGYSIPLWDRPAESVTYEPLPVGEDWVLGGLRVPEGFQFVAPDRRRQLLGEAVGEATAHIAREVGWDSAPVRATVERAAAEDFACRWTSPWKSTKDRRLRVRIAGELHDDGYLRWRAQTAGRDTDEILGQTPDLLGWTWMENLHRMARDMRLTGPRELTVGSGSRIDSVVTVIDLDSATVTSRRSGIIEVNSLAITRRRKDKPPRSYRGDPRRAPRL